jgi:peptidylprolyl isomerase/peptidyl-prolyl cis-trans isomerase D
MNRLRENTGVILWILVISFGVIWVLQDSGAFEYAGSPGSDIIVVDGDPVSYEEYNNFLNNQIDAYQQQTGEQVSPQRMDMLRDQVFDALVENKLREHAMEELGITVTDDEVFNLVIGDNPHPIIRRNFGDEQGNIDRELLQSFIDDPAAQQQWIQIEQYLRRERRQQKLNKLISATVRVSEEDVLEEYRKRNFSVDADYVLLRYASLPNDSVEVTERDLRNFYQENRDDYKRQRSYTVEYVHLPKSPTAADSASALESVGRLRSSFAETEDDSTFLAQYGSDRSYTDTFFRRDELDAGVADVVYDVLEPDSIVGPVVVGDLVHLIKIIDVRPAEETVVNARHILIRAPERDTDARAEARQRILDIQERIEEGADFAAMARQFSDDTGSGQRGGDLGWFGPGRMVESFEEAAFGAEPGEIVGPVETRFGYHLIQVQDRADQEVKIVDFAEPLRASSETLTDRQEQLEDLRFYAEESSYEEEANRLELEIQQVEVEADQENIPGIGVSNALMTFLEEADEGDMSDVIELDEQFIVAHVASITPEGYRPFEEVQAEVEPRAYKEKKKEILTQRMEQALAQNDFDGLAQALGTTQQQASDISFSNMTVPGLGRDPVFAGTVLGLDEGEVSDVVASENGVFVARVTQVNTPPPISDTERQQIRQRLQQQRQAQIQRQWIASLREQAEIEDLRRRFQ